MKEFLEDVRDYCRTHTFTEIVAAVWKSGRRYYSENPLDLATLVTSLISLGVSSVVIVIAILSPQCMLDKRRADGFPTQLETGADVMKWWIGEDNRLKENDDQITLFGLRMDESSV